MPKYDYLKGVVEQLSESVLRDLVEAYAKKDKDFEAFLLEESGIVVETGKNYEDYREEMMKILDKCSSRKGFVKVTRLRNAGMGSYEKLINSHFQNQNYRTALWMCLAFMEMMHGAILQNTRYTWASKPYKTFEKIFLQTQEQFETCFEELELSREKRPIVFDSLLRMWWKERERPYEHRYFQSEEILKKAKRDEDLLALHTTLQPFKEEAERIDQRQRKQVSAWKKVWAGFVSDDEMSELEKPLLEVLEAFEDKVNKQLNSW
jgi:hypothetical protein